MCLNLPTNKKTWAYLNYPMAKKVNSQDKLIERRSKSFSKQHQAKKLITNTPAIKGDLESIILLRMPEKSNLLEIHSSLL
jgi:hypothetical protein